MPLDIKVSKETVIIENYYTERGNHEENNVGLWDQAGSNKKVSAVDQVLEIFGITPDYDLNIMNDRQNLFDITTNVLNGMRGVLEEVRPDLVLVHGDTSTSLVTALSCFYLQIPVGHVEAGLRTYNIQSPYPEEFNREGKKENLSG